MAEEKDLNTIIRKMYARELDLIVHAPDIEVRQQRPAMTIRERLWTNQSAAVKIAAVSFVLLIVSATIYYYNFFTVNAYQAMRERANVDAYLQRRSDLIPNLVKSASQYLSYEKNIFAHIAEVRGAVAGMKTLEQSLEKAGIQDKSVLSKFQAVAEAYPALKASETYTTLMKELSDTESKLTDSRISYNKTVNYYNSRLQMFPGVIFNTLLFRFKPLPEFETTASLVPDVHLSDTGQHRIQQIQKQQQQNAAPEKLKQE